MNIKLPLIYKCYTLHPHLNVIVIISNVSASVSNIKFRKNSNFEMGLQNLKTILLLQNHSN